MLKDPQRNTTETNTPIEFLYPKESENIKNLFSQNPPDSVIIEDLCDELDMRKNHIESKDIPHDVIANDNAKCLSLVEDMLEKIDWAKYPAITFDD